MTATAKVAQNPSFKIIEAPHRDPDDRGPTNPSIFLGGSIIDGWQKKLSASLYDLPITILNPLREDWEAIGVEDISNPAFREQTDWELDMQCQASLVVIYFAAETKAPVSLLELGLATAKAPESVLVCCPKGFWKKGNVDVVCSRFGISVLERLDEVENVVRERIGKMIDL
ncbi:hypothetical protein PVAG01_02853 [Phlyctema vagabunda]|uniref:Nucleoside 2-deoxyribosyltransferase like protein n=1 Tax=Phlyctema vagabunda TaxID=108571 RepID=A0ABR4PRV7_9HELO